MEPLSAAATSCVVQRRSYSVLRSRRLCNRSHVSATATGNGIRRHRSSWTRDMRSFWHRPDCSWVHSEGDPRTTPRDKDCPACQYETKRPLELSMRELMWERKMELMKNYVEKDPYQALFGKSNERLRNLLGRVDEEWRMPWFGRRRAGLSWWSLGENGDGNYNRAEKSASSDFHKETKSTQSTPSEPSISTAPKPEPPSNKHATPAKPAASIPEDDSVFDPITMRRVPRESQTPSSNISETINNKHVSVDIPVKTFAISRVESKHSLTPVIRLDKPASEKIAQSQATPYAHTSKQQTRSEPAPTAALDTGNSAGECPGRRVPDFWSGKTSSSSLQNTQYTRPAGSIRAPVSDPANRNVNAKAALEASWIKERESRRKSFPADVSKAAATKEHELAQHIDQVNSKVLSSAHFSRSAPTNDSVADKRCYVSNHKRDRPFKHMNAHELGHHRAFLLAAWSRKHQLQPKLETPADELLNAEINAQKAAMRAFEVRSRPFGPLRDVVPGEALEEAYSNHSHTAKLANDVLAEKEKVEDAALVREIKDIYENAYGNVRPADQHEANKTSLTEYEPDLPPGEYDFMMSQESLEQEVRKPAEVLKSGYEEPTYYDKSLGPSGYSFKMGQDNLEAELKQEAVTPKSGYDMPTYFDRRQGNTAYSFKQDNPEHKLGTGCDAVSGSTATEHYSDVSATDAEAPKPHNRALADLLSALSRSRPPTSQVSPPPVRYTSSSTDPQLYQIIAWDTKDQSVYTATASSRFSPPTGTTVLPLENALIRLAKPMKFLPFIEKYQAKGYEVVSANEKLLVMKRMQQPEGTTDKTHSSSTESVWLPGQSTKASMEALAEDKASNEDRSDFLPAYLKLQSKVRNKDIFLTYASDRVQKAKERLQRTSSAKLVRKEEPVFSGTQRRWDDATAAPISATAGGSGSPPQGTGAASSNGHEKQPEQEQPPRKSNNADSESDAGSRQSSFMTRAVPRVVGILGLCYITGYIIEYLRDREGPRGGNSSGSASNSHGSHSSRMTYAPGLTDRAMWSPTPKEDRANDAARQLAAGKNGERQQKRLERGDANGEMTDADAATMFGTALCVVSALGLLSNFIYRGK